MALYEFIEDHDLYKKGHRMQLEEDAPGVKEFLALKKVKLVKEITEDKVEVKKAKK